MLLFGLVAACAFSDKPSQSHQDSVQPRLHDPKLTQTKPIADYRTSEMRGIWVTRWSWNSPEEVEAILTHIAAAGLNTVFFQVRGSFDAYYASAIEPWAERLTGSLGTDPGWDPLAHAVEFGHALGLQVHAYLNVFPISPGSHSPTPGTSPPHAYHEHPDWRVVDTNGVMQRTSSPDAIELKYVFASPGNLQVRAHISTVASDINERYDVDGIHLDYLRYPGPHYSRDTVSRARKDAAIPWDEWQREQINDTVQRVRDGVEVPVTAAVWGVYENRWGWSQVSEGNIDYYQDSRALLERGLLDATLPMIYWPVTEPSGQRLDFRTLALDHLAHAGGRHVYPGISTMPTDEEPDPYSRVATCIQTSRSIGAPGWVLFDYVNAKPILERLRTYLLAEDVPPPEMPWR